MKVSILLESVRGKPHHVVTWTDSRGVRRRSFHQTEDTAKAAAADLRENVARIGDAWRDLTSAQRADVMNVAHEVHAAGLTLRDVWEAHRAAGRVVATVTLKDAINSCITEKRGLGRRPAYIAALEYTLGLFSADREAIPVASITTADCETWLSTKRNPSVRSSFQTRLSTLFAWCVQRGHITVNPVGRIGKVSVEQRPPVILTPAQVDSGLEWVRGRDIEPYFVLGLFCGIRPDELLRLRWESVDLRRGLVTIDAATSKVRRRRIVPIAPRALAILTVANKEKIPACWPQAGGGLSTAPRAGVIGESIERSIEPGGESLSVAKQLREPVFPKQISGRSGPVWPLSAQSLKRRRAELLRAAGLPRSSDILRHTCASYMMARDGDAGRVAGVLGNSPGVLLTRYRELVSPEDAALFWGV